MARTYTGSSNPAPRRRNFSRREAILTWARLSYGFMGRTPDYKAAFMASMPANPSLYAPFEESAKGWYRKYSSQCLFFNHVLINPPVDRNRPVHEVEDVFVHVVRERDGGIVVSGAKMLATGSALTHATFVAQNSAVTLDKEKAKDFAIVFIAPMNAPGVKLICRRSYEQKAHSPFDHPLSSRFDENDAVIVFDNVFIPWEDVLIYRDPQKANSFYGESRFVNRFTLQAGSRLLVKLEMIVGMFAKAIATNGTDSFRGVQAALGEILAWRNLMQAVTTAMCLDRSQPPAARSCPRPNLRARSRCLLPSAGPRFANCSRSIWLGAFWARPPAIGTSRIPSCVPSSISTIAARPAAPRNGSSFSN